jgi:hypothetical protein
MKDYLNNGELKELIILATVDVFCKHFTDSDVMSREEKGNLKRGNTFIEKSITSMLKRLGDKEIQKYKRASHSSKIIVITESELEVLKKRKTAELKDAYSSNKEYFKLVELTMDANCKNCTKSCNECELANHFDEQEVIPFSEEEIDLGNCKYAYRKD